MNQSYIIGGVIVALVVAYGIYALIRNKQRKDADWTGEVIDKAIKEQVHDNTRDTSGGSGFSVNTGGPSVTHKYYITVRPATGEQFDWEISSGLYETIAIGDQVAKHPGTAIPEVVAKSISQPAASVPSPSVAPAATPEVSPAAQIPGEDSSTNPGNPTPPTTLS